MKIELDRSGMFSDVGYNAGKEELELTWRRGGKSWRFYGIGAKLYSEFMAAPSLNDFYQEHIRGKYTSEAI